jgi:hypothetical protein
MTEGDRANRVAMVGAFQRKESRRRSGAPGSAGEFVGQLQGDFEGSGSVVREKGSNQFRSDGFPTSGQARELSCELAGGWIGKSQGGGVGHLFQLLSESAVEMRMIVAVQIGPNGGIRVQVSSAMDILQDRSSTTRQDYWLLPEPILHLRKRVPDVFLIKSGKVGFHRRG